MIPARTVAVARPDIPSLGLFTMAYMITVKAPVGPPIWTFVPPKAAMQNPAIMAVYKPVSGLHPDAMAKAIDRGSATIPTIIPAIRSEENCLAL